MESADRASGPPHCESLRTDQFDVVYYSDDHGDTWHLARNESGASARLAGLDEPALAETPSGGVIVRARNERFHGPGRCDCRGAAESHDGGDTMTGGVTFDAGLPEPVCEGTLLNDLPSGKIFSAMPGFGTDVEKKDGHNGRGNGVVRWSSDGGKSWGAALKLWQGYAYSYSCLTRVPLPGYIGLAWETVLPYSYPHKRDISANNIVGDAAFEPADHCGPTFSVLISRTRCRCSA